MYGADKSFTMTCAEGDAEVLAQELQSHLDLSSGRGLQMVLEATAPR
jgi:hypothetical protein